MPTPGSNARIDTYLSGVLAGYSNKSFGLVNSVPSISSSGDTGKLAKITNDHFRLDYDQRNYGSTYHRVDYDYSTDTYTAIEYGLEIALDDRWVKNFSDPLRAERDATIVLAHKMNLRLEKAIADAIQSTDAYNGTDWYDTTTAHAWEGTGDPAYDVGVGINQCISQTGADPFSFVGVCSYNVFNALMANENLRANYTSTTPGAANRRAMTPADIAAALGLKALYVSAASYNSANEGATESFSSVMNSDDFVVFAHTESPGILNDWFIAKITPEGEGGDQPVIERYRDESRRSTILRVRNAWDLLIGNDKLGYWWQDVIGT
jgi:hypothetical protein